jgi:phosphoserine phosphatase
MNDTKHLILIRHGATDWNLPGRLNSFTDNPLNQQGISEVKKLAKYIKSSFPHATIWTSPLTRAQETAKIISDVLGVSVNTLSRATEINFGRFEGKTPKELDTEPEVTYFSAWESGQIVEGVESFDDAAIRAKQIYNEVIENGDSHQNILVSHGAFIRILICVKALNISPTSYRSLLVDNGSVSVLQITSKRIRLSQLNNKCYISPNSEAE